MLAAPDRFLALIAAFYATLCALFTAAVCWWLG
jgi:hypothetical protein